ncbi:hypothetical protein DSM106972_068050 [Dulcicalothrix desertica PCC 7102]|uniref:DUF1819 domain-containing protein n=1 Tax=Dulcicalothrix desertica PCC 7102 TaxID=232991 RepID=A0A3S1AHY6_9CYAN|nr:BrxA family protein [Dulcicalothrix desertica]RUT01254.1 hypothetical protein DSM106972_068050 [Dulcicalothrix desertica PCC 7102]TWH40595.1 putative inner membrane protein DUF1819 [Dulcicalothrix desertica PCC 7102]
MPQSYVYTSKIIKAGALIADTKTLLANWDLSRTVDENLDKFLSENIFGKASRSRVEDILAIFRQRYLMEAPVTKALVTLVNHRLRAEVLNCILYFHATQSDRLLHDVVTDLLADLYHLGRQDISVNDVKNWISKQIAEGKTSGAWSDSTITRCAREILSTLRDFGILKGAVKKHLAPVYLPVEAFAYIALYLKQHQPSGEKLINASEWQLFFLSTKAVERFFMEAHQHGLLEYRAAGSIIRIDFPTESIAEYAHVIAS